MGSWKTHQAAHGAAHLRRRRGERERGGCGAEKEEERGYGLCPRRAPRHGRELTKEEVTMTHLELEMELKRHGAQSADGSHHGNGVDLSFLDSTRGDGQGKNDNVGNSDMDISNGADTVTVD